MKITKNKGRIFNSTTKNSKIIKQIQQPNMF